MPHHPSTTTCHSESAAADEESALGFPTAALFRSLCIPGPTPEAWQKLAQPVRAGKKTPLTNFPFGGFFAEPFVSSALSSRDEELVRPRASQAEPTSSQLAACCFRSVNLNTKW